MLNQYEMGELWEFQKSIPDEEIRELLHQVLFEYNEYTKCGSIEDCINRQEWMDMSLEDVRISFNGLVRDLREEVQNHKAELSEKFWESMNPKPNNKRSKKGTTVKED